MAGCGLPCALTTPDRPSSLPRKHDLVAGFHPEPVAGVENRPPLGFAKSRLKSGFGFAAFKMMSCPIMEDTACRRRD